MSKKKQKKNKKGKSIGYILVFALLLCSFWGFENYTFKVDKVEIVSSKIQDEIKIVHISDLHGAKYGKENEFLIKSIEKQKPDFIVATGDMYSSTKAEKQMPVAVDFLAKLANKFPVYFVVGEHDRADNFIDDLKKSKVRVLENENVEIGNITIYGTNRVYFPEEYNVSDDFEQLNQDRYNILLAHIPEYKYYADFGFDLVLSGDTHGGIADIPFVGIANYNGEWFPERGDNWNENTTPVKGLYNLNNNGKMYVSGGLGNYPVPARLFNRPEYGVITLKNKG